jgi:hypothetical protein
MEDTWAELALEPPVAATELFREVAVVPAAREWTVGATRPRVDTATPKDGMGDLALADEAAVGLVKVLSELGLTPTGRLGGAGACVEVGFAETTGFLRTAPVDLG